MEITKIYPLDAVYDTLEDVPEDVRKILLFYDRYEKRMAEYILYILLFCEFV